VIQTFLPEHYAIALARTHDYPSFFREELARREPHGYPPLRTLVRVAISGADAARVRRTAEALADRARELAGAHDAQVLGPAPALVERIRDEYHWQLVLLAQREPAHALARALQQQARKHRADARVRVVRGPTEML
jgi:primosomal protein N' (replication factor Y) (superfamily II helicase)